MATYQELVTRAETAAASAAQSASNTAADKLTVQGYVDRITGLLNNASTLTTPTITVDPQTGRISVSCSASVGNVASSTIKTNTLLLSEVAGNNLDPAIIKDGETIFGVTGSYQGSGGSYGSGNAVVITQFIPERAEFTAPSSFVVSGFSGDYESWNGTYSVTAGTEHMQSLARIYKMSNENKYLIGFYDEYDVGGNVWGFSTSPSTTSVYSCVAAMPADTPASGSWMNYDAYESTNLTISKTDTTYPAQQQVIQGKVMDSYDQLTHMWQPSNTISNFTGYEESCVEQNVYFSSNSIIIGTPIGFYTGLPVLGAHLYMPLTNMSKTALTGQALSISESAHEITTYLNKQCMHIHGSVLLVTVAKHPYNISNTDDFTLHIRVCFEEQNAGGIFVLGSNDGENGVAINLKEESAGVFSFGYSDASNGYGVTIDSAYRNAELNKWYSICLVRQSGVAYFYINNRLVHTGAFSTRVDTVDGYTGIGGRGPNSYGSTYTNMYACDAILYKRALSASEIALLAGSESESE